MSLSFFRRLALPALCCLAALLLGTARPARAQSVVGVSEILSSTDSSEIDTYSATEIDYQTSLYYGAYVEGYLYQNGSLIASGSASDPSNAYGYMSKPLQVPDQYQLQSDHYLVATYVYATIDGQTYWDNPDYYLISTGGSYDPSTGNFASGGGPAYYNTRYFYLGSTAVQMSSAGPTITSVSPAAATVGTSGTITVYGSNLVDVFTNQASASMSGSGIALSVNSATASQITLHYMIASNAGTGSQNLTLSTRFGTSNAAAFQVGDPTPVVSSVSPSIWNAGTTTTVAITGSSFGTNPSLTVTGPGVSGWTISSSSDTQIVANVTVAANSPGGSGSVQVQSNGYLGNGFAPANPGQSADSALESILIQYIPAPPPQIIFQGMNVSATTQNVVVGQQIALTVSTSNIPAGLSIQSQSWSFSNSSAASAGFVNTAGSGPPSASGGGMEAPLPPLTQNSLTFYWVALNDPGEAVT